jgi:hypothetical protein
MPPLSGALQQCAGTGTNIAKIIAIMTLCKEGTENKNHRSQCYN